MSLPLQIGARHMVRAVEMVFEGLEPRLFMTGTVSKQIVVDQFGWRTDAESKVALFAKPINGQNAGEDYNDDHADPAHFQIRKTSDNSIVYTGDAVAWISGATDSESVDKVWSAVFSDFNTAGSYYIYDADN